MKPRNKSIQHTIIPFDYPTDFNAWSLMIQQQMDAIRGLEIEDKAPKTDEEIMESMIEEVYTWLTFNN